MDGVKARERTRVCLTHSPCFKSGNLLWDVFLHAVNVLLPLVNKEADLPTRQKESSGKSTDSGRKERLGDDSSC